jgi:hypothetical protein
LRKTPPQTFTPVSTPGSALTPIVEERDMICDDTSEALDTDSVLGADIDEKDDDNFPEEPTKPKSPPAEVYNQNSNTLLPKKIPVLTQRYDDRR